MKCWLKMVGAADWPLDNEWIEQRPELLREVRSPWRPSGIKRDDKLVYYAAVHQRLFAIARAEEDGEEAQETSGPGEERWPWLLHARVQLAIPRIQQAPDWSALGISRSSIQQKSYIEISADQYRKAWNAITEKTRI